jgi:hypothetical protein
MNLTPEQIATIEAWRDNFNPGALKHLEDSVRAYRHFVERNSGEAAKLVGLEKILAMATELAVRQ